MLMSMFRAIVSGDDTRVLQLLRATPALARQPAPIGASRGSPAPFYFKKITHYVYAGDTALHVAAAAYRVEIANELLARGADVSARNRRGAEPLHYAADGMPGSSHWNPGEQAATIVCLIRAGADPNSGDNRGVMPLHRAVRTRCAAAVRTLLEHGADPSRKSGTGSTPLRLAVQNTGRGGSGSTEARLQQAEILELLAPAADSGPPLLI
jgi:hypothetical protein